MAPKKQKYSYTQDDLIKIVSQQFPDVPEAKVKQIIYIFFDDLLDIILQQKILTFYDFGRFKVSTLPNCFKEKNKYERINFVASPKLKKILKAMKVVDKLVDHEKFKERELKKKQRILGSQS